MDSTGRAVEDVVRAVNSLTNEVREIKDLFKKGKTENTVMRSRVKFFKSGNGELGIIEINEKDFKVFIANEDNNNYWNFDFRNKPVKAGDVVLMSNGAPGAYVFSGDDGSSSEISILGHTVCVSVEGNIIDIEILEK